MVYIGLNIYIENWRAVVKEMLLVSHICRETEKTVYKQESITLEVMCQVHFAEIG